MAQSLLFVRHPGPRLSAVQLDSSMASTTPGALGVDTLDDGPHVACDGGYMVPMTAMRPTHIPTGAASIPYPPPTSVELAPSANALLLAAVAEPLRVSTAATATSATS